MVKGTRVHNPFVADDAGQFVAIPHLFWEAEWPRRLSASAIVVYIYLKYRAGASNDAYPSLATIGRESGVSKSTAVRAIAELSDHGLIAIEHRKSEHSDADVNHYRVLNLRQGVVSNLDDRSYQTRTTGGVKSGLKQDTSEQDTSEQTDPDSPVSVSDRPISPNGLSPRENPRREPNGEFCRWPRVGIGSVQPLVRQLG